MLTHTGTKQRSDDRTTNLSRLIIIGNLRIDLFSVATVRDKNVWWENQQPAVNPKCGLRGCGMYSMGNRRGRTISHDIDPPLFLFRKSLTTSSKIVTT